jgi:hypothetical protein
MTSFYSVHTYNRGIKGQCQAIHNISLGKDRPTNQLVLLTIRLRGGKWSFGKKNSKSKDFALVFDHGLNACK